ncbi:hypothetical protein SODALDRAFT_335169 [Sodiomyces alkalinus F11]|uniref:DNA replication regulator Sld3 C-terminal domain-containing protein n=1 Tax=Sodiomyces alkalinus (strain CBS 110278 / VKM F-3762 / F11) TaxID=1314773 RepID=A0A3N2PR19_SODAK|nr:hypothetical protein SODALDRAFT_335169 [Sodiomyces alkalinus F11]ROT36952.1 hypothetical protein SODALDRAFT_335169 [Sodiomyces alkalinus F11]
MSTCRPAASPDASHPPSRILTPSSDNSLNQSHAKSLDGFDAKGRQGSSALEHLLKPSIVVRPHPPDVLAKPCTLQPILLLKRRHLPLSLLDLSSPHGNLHSSRFYESHIKILDLEDRMAVEPSVLIARNEATRVIYAIERSDAKLYTVCKLGSWVDVLELSSAATVSNRQLLRPGRPALADMPTAPLTTPHLHKEQKQKRLAIEALQSVVRKRGRSQSVSALEIARAEKRSMCDNGRPSPPTSSNLDTPEDSDMPRNHTGPQDIDTLEHQPPDATVPGDSATSELRVPTTPDDVLDRLRAQYMDALYASKGSLAYFAKGPLSRARAAFHLDCDMAFNMSDLIDFLKSLIMTTVQVDKKYRETIPDIIATMKTLIETSDEENKPKKRRPKKMRIGKDGLYPSEESHVREWWTANKLEASEEDGNIPGALVKSHVDLLRTRETQLQMILIMEILALEPLRAQENDVESQLPGLSAAPDSDSRAPAAQTSRKRNKHNFPVLVDVHADRLCIWQSTASDELRLLEDSQVITQAPGQPAQKASADPLKDFCTDIILPFFAARLPELCDSISRKLGGPVIIPPEKPEKPRQPTRSSEARPKPGTAAKRPTLSSSASKTIERALHKEQSRRSVSRGPSSTIALMRSATSAVIPGLKREASEQNALGGLSRNPERNMSHDRTRSLSRSSSLTALDNPRAQKKAMVEAELKNAIDAIRKPNRVLVGKAIVEEAAERRTSGGLSHIKKSKKPTRHPLFQTVQVKATPTNNRFRDALATEARGSDMHMPKLGLPPSSASMIPSTAPRRGTRDALEAAPSSAIMATPSKPSASSRVDVSEVACVPGSSPLMERKAARLQQLASPTHAATQKNSIAISASPMADGGILETPVKGPRFFTLPQEEISSTPIKNLNNQTTTNGSIYERLGWDNDYDDL